MHKETAWWFLTKPFAWLSSTSVAAYILSLFILYVITLQSLVETIYHIK